MTAAPPRPWVTKTIGTGVDGAEEGQLDAGDAGGDEIAWLGVHWMFLSVGPAPAKKAGVDGRGRVPRTIA